MILADKIIKERKKNGWSQEDLAEKLNVSRQSVSKWESAQSVPDLKKILKLSEIFNVSTDYLLKESYDEDKKTINETENDKIILEKTPKETEKICPVNMEEASEYISLQEKNAHPFALAVALCITSPVLLLILLALSYSNIIGITEKIATGIGLTALFFMVAAAVFVFVKYATQMSKFEYLKKTVIETAYGIDDMVKEKKKNFSKTYSMSITIGVVLCILSALPLIITSILTKNEMAIMFMVGVLLFIVAVAVYLFVKVSLINECYNILLQEEEYSKEKKREYALEEKIGGLYWCTITTIYLAWSFISMHWHRTWIIWPIAGVLYSVIMAMVNIMKKEK